MTLLTQMPLNFNKKAQQTPSKKQSFISFKKLNEYQEPIFNSLKNYLGEKGIQEGEKSLTRIKEALGKNFDKKTVLVAYGGGKDSSYMTAFIRYLQLKVLEPLNSNKTFKLRIVTNRQSHMPQRVMQNIDNVFNATGVYKDSKLVEPLVVDGEKVTKLSEQMPITMVPIPKKVIERDKKDMLMAGHLTNAEGRRIYCDACNSYMQKGEAHAITRGKGVDLIVTGDSIKELAHYKRWINSLNTFINPENTEAQSNQKQGFMDYMAKINDIAKKYFEDIHGETGKDRYQMPQLKEGQKSPKLFTIYGDTPYDAGSHRKMLDEFLGFKFDPESLAFSFTESDCSMPALMAHLRGIKAERLQDRSYNEGVKEYVDKLAIPIMKDKKFPQDLIKMQEELYSSPEKIEQMRYKVSQHYQNTMHLSEDNLVCMVYSPFAEEGKNLELYLKNEKPELLPNIETIKDIISGTQVLNSKPNIILIKNLEESSGITLKDMQHLYSKKLFAPPTGNSPKNVINANHPTLIDRFNQDDPHKKVIQTGEDNHFELMSGR